MDQPHPDMTIVEAIDALRAAGFRGDFAIREGGVRCGGCGHAHAPDELDIERIYRIEGQSDPADEALVAGLRCQGCGSLGVLVAGYGPTADPAEADVLKRLVDDRPR